jgi:hypothetical protein
VATGYKAGGFNDGCLAGANQLGLSCPAALAVPAQALVYQPETVRSYEAGVKTRFWDNKASLNLSVFKYDYKNLQLSSVAIVSGAPRFVTSNAGKPASRDWKPKASSWSRRVTASTTRCRCWTRITCATPRTAYTTGPATSSITRRPTR